MLHISKMHKDALHYPVHFYAQKAMPEKFYLIGYFHSGKVTPWRCRTINIVGVAVCPTVKVFLICLKDVLYATIEFAIPLLYTI